MEALCVEHPLAAVPRAVPVPRGRVGVAALLPAEAEVLSQAEARRDHELLVAEAQARVRWDRREPRARPGPPAGAHPGPPRASLGLEELAPARVLQFLAELPLLLPEGREPVLPAPRVVGRVAAHLTLGVKVRAPGRQPVAGVEESRGPALLRPSGPVPGELRLAGPARRARVADPGERGEPGARPGRLAALVEAP